MSDHEPVYVNMEATGADGADYPPDPSPDAYLLPESQTSPDGFSTQAVTSQSPGDQYEPSYRQVSFQRDHSSIGFAHESAHENLGFVQRRPTLVERLSIRRGKQEQGTADTTPKTMMQTQPSDVTMPDDIPTAPPPPPIAGARKPRHQSVSMSSQTPVSLIEMLSTQGSMSRAREAEPRSGYASEELKESLQARNLKPDFTSESNEEDNLNSNCNQMEESAIFSSSYCDSDESSASNTISLYSRDTTIDQIHGLEEARTTSASSIQKDEESRTASVSSAAFDHASGAVNRTNNLVAPGVAPVSFPAVSGHASGAPLRTNRVSALTSTPTASIPATDGGAKPDARDSDSMSRLDSLFEEVQTTLNNAMDTSHYFL